MAYITPEELRVFLQFDKNDYPTPSDMEFFIKISEAKITLELDSSDTNILMLSSLMLSKAFVLRGLATRSVGKGYITINAEGRNITKAYQELVLEAENVESEYKEFIRNIGRRETTKTNFMTDTTAISNETRQRFIDVLSGTQNAIDSGTTDKRQYGRLWR